jgi:hypothetical protein
MVFFGKMGSVKQKLKKTKKNKKEVKAKNISQKATFWLTDPRPYLVIITIAFLIHANHFRYHIVDDAFTSFRYAQNLIDGYGLVYNPGERVEGYTNFLWTLIIACFMKIGFSPEPVSQILGTISGGIGIILLFLLSSLIAPKNKFLNLIAPLFLSVNSCYAVWSTAGMETTFFTVLVLLGATRYVYEIQNKREMPLSSVIFGIASLTRFEGLLFFGITFIYQAILVIKKRILPKTLLVSLLLFFSIFLPYYIWRYTYYGWPLPNTFYAKVGSGTDQYIRGLNYIKKFLFEFSGWIFLMILLVFRKISIYILYLLLITFSYLLYVIYIGGDGLSIYRFMVPILPFLYLLFKEGIVSLYEIVSKKKALVVTLIIVSIGASLTVKNSFLNASDRGLKLVNLEAINTKGWTMVGKWLAKNALKGESVALIPAGAIPYYSKLYTIDMVGLNDLNIGHMRLEGMGTGIAGHEKGDGAYVLSRRPTYILLGNVLITNNPELDFASLPWEGWVLKSEYELWFDQKFHQMYQQVASHLGGGWYLHYFKLKKNSS